MPDDPRRLVYELHEGLERLASLIPQAPPPPKPEVVQVLAGHLGRLLDVRAGVSLIRDLERAEAPLPEEAIDGWAAFLRDRTDRWAPLLDPTSLDDLLEDLECDGPAVLVDLDWPRARIVAATKVGMTLPQTGARWKDETPDWSDLPKSLRTRALDLFAREFDGVMETLYMGESFVDWGIVNGLPHYVEEALPTVVTGPLDQWRWLLDRIRPSFSTDGLYGSYDAREVVVSAFLNLPLPEATADRAELLCLLAHEVPDCLRDEGLSDRLSELEQEFGIEDAREVKPATLRRKLKRALQAEA